jgi:hypothetical protein
MSTNENTNQRTITLRLEFGRRQLVAFLALALLVLTPGDLVTEQLTLTTYYPSPYGVYEELRSTQNTYLSYSGGNTCIGSSSCATKLTVSGAAYIGGNTTVTGSETISGNSQVNGLIHVKGVYQDRNSRTIRDANGGWVRTYGNTGWYNGSWGGGWYMVDSSWIRTYGNKSIYHNTGTMRTDGEFQVGSNGSRFRVRTNGRVGISVSSPSELLDVNGNVRVRGRLVRACRWYSYGVGTQRYCPSRWSVFTASHSSGRMDGTIPGSGRMYCCRFTEY